MLKEKVQQRGSKVVRRAMEGMANLGERTFQPGIRRTCSSLRGVARDSRPLVEQAREFVHSLSRNEDTVCTIMLKMISYSKGHLITEKAGAICR